MRTLPSPLPFLTLVSVIFSICREVRDAVRRGAVVTRVTSGSDFSLNRQRGKQYFLLRCCFCRAGCQKYSR